MGDPRRVAIGRPLSTCDSLECPSIAEMPRRADDDPPPPWLAVRRRRGRLKRFLGWTGMLTVMWLLMNDNSATLWPLAAVMFALWGAGLSEQAQEDGRPIDW